MRRHTYISRHTQKDIDNLRLLFGNFRRKTRYLVERFMIII